MSDIIPRLPERRIPTLHLPRRTRYNPTPPLPYRKLTKSKTGDNGLTEYTHRTSKPSAKNPGQKPPASEWKNNRFRVYFPSQTTVDESPGGPASAGTICFQSRWYEGAKFPREILRDCESSRRYLLMHNKVSPCPAILHSMARTRQ